MQPAPNNPAPIVQPVAPPIAQPFEIVRKDERDAIAKLRELRGVGNEQELFGMGLSGGGIRSATLSLGILQAFAKYDLLKRVDYLSTVSGGGYIGSWLTAWIHRQGLPKVTNSLNPEPNAQPSPDPQPRSWLRQFSNYLTPNLSAFNADTWSLAAIWSRNTLLNLLVLVTAIASLLLVPRIAGLALQFVPKSSDWLLLGLTLGFLLIATIFIGRNLKVFGREKPGKWRGSGQSAALAFIVLPTFLASLVLTAWLAVDVERFSGEGFLEGIRDTSIGFFALYAVILWYGDFRGCFDRQHQNLPQPVRIVVGRLLALMIATVSAFLTAALFRFLADLVESWPRDQRVWAAFTCGPPAILLVFALGVIIQIGLMGVDLGDEAREWLGRLRAWMMIFSAAWLVFGATSIYGPLWIAAIGAWWGKTGIALATGWITSTIGGVMAGKSDKSGGKGKSDNSSSASALDLIAGVGPYLFLVGFLLAISFGIHVLVAHVDPACTLPTKAVEQPACKICAEASADGKTVKVTATTTETIPSSQFLAKMQADYWNQMNNQTLWALVTDNCTWFVSVLANLFLICAAACLLFAWRVDINEFSLHHFYRNRLIRAYLGASNCKRNQNPFTGFDENDDIPLAKLLDAPNPQCPDAEPNFKEYDGPYPIVNATLNLSVGRNLAWQERQSASFIFSPLYTGFDTGYDLVNEHGRGNHNRRARVDELDIGDAPVSGLELYGYQKTCAFGDGGPRLGTAMAISGAAANPNHGYHTSTVVAFLLTVFDVRLGWWFANPRRSASLAYASPVFGFGYLVKELLGLTDARTQFVNLSDAGHFDNMGLYELVRRRCRYIVICDGEQDQDLTFGGLATAIRMCRVDFNTEIYIDLDKIRKKNGKDGPAEFSEAHWAVGTIHYPEDRENPAHLLYLKSSLTGDETADVLEYHSREPLFPHQSTGDQWFDESQFESYRRLGQHIGMKLLNNRNTADLDTLFAEIADT